MRRIHFNLRKAALGQSSTGLWYGGIEAYVAAYEAYLQWQKIVIILIPETVQGKITSAELQDERYKNFTSLFVYLSFTNQIGSLAKQIR